MDFMADYPSFARLWVSENWRTPSVWQDTFADSVPACGGDWCPIDRVAATGSSGQVHLPGEPGNRHFRSVLCGGPGPPTYNPERTREQSIAAIMAISAWLRQEVATSGGRLVPSAHGDSGKTHDRCSRRRRGPSGAPAAVTLKEAALYELLRSRGRWLPCLCHPGGGTGDVLWHLLAGGVGTSLFIGFAIRAFPAHVGAGLHRGAGSAGRGFFLPGTRTSTSRSPRFPAPEHCWVCSPAHGVARRQAASVRPESSSDPGRRQTRDGGGACSVKCQATGGQACRPRGCRRGLRTCSGIEVGCPPRAGGEAAGMVTRQGSWDARVRPGRGSPPYGDP